VMDDDQHLKVPILIRNSTGELIRRINQTQFVPANQTLDAVPFHVT